jgi:hypothetical protein
MSLPDYNFLAAPLWLVTVLHVVTLTLHFLAMNFLLGGLIVLLMGRIENRWEDPTVRKFLKLFPSVMAATVTLGVAPLLFLQLVYYQQAYSASIVSGWFWILIIDVAIVAYYLLYGASLGRRAKGLLLSLALLGLVYISFVYSTVFSMAERPEMYQRLYAACQSGLTINDQPGTWVFRWLHMLTGAVTVGAFFVGLLGRDNPPVFALGKRFFLWGMVGAMVLGLVYLFTLGDILVPLMRSPAIWVLTLSILLSLGALHFFFKKRFLPAGLMVFLSLLGMVVVRHTLRLLVLEGVFDPASIPVRPQWDVFVIFLVCFLAAVALVAVMLRLYFRSPAPTE